jgi:hypothetical protein
VKGHLHVTRFRERLACDTKSSVILEYSHVLYTKKSDDPVSFAKCATSGNRRSDGKLHGKYYFPFAFAFPTEVISENVKSGFPAVTWELPPSFSDKDSGVMVKYELKVIAERCKY